MSCHHQRRGDQAIGRTVRAAIGDTVRGDHSCRRDDENAPCAAIDDAVHDNEVTASIDEAVRDDEFAAINDSVRDD